MANHKQAIKRHRQSLKRNARNNFFKATARTYLKRARTALEGGDKGAAAEAVRLAASYLDHVASKGIIPKERASRLKSRLDTQLSSL